MNFQGYSQNKAPIMREEYRQRRRRRHTLPLKHGNPPALESPPLPAAQSPCIKAKT